MSLKVTDVTKALPRHKRHIPGTQFISGYLLGFKEHTPQKKFVHVVQDKDTDNKISSNISLLQG